MPSVYDTMKPLLFSNVKGGTVSNEDSSDVNKTKSVGKLVSSDDANDLVKSTSLPNKDRMES